MEYFPLILKQRILRATNNSLEDIDEITQQVRIIHQGEQVEEPHIFCQGDFLEEDILYEVCLNPELRKVGKWAMERIVLQKIEWQTLQVRLNIAINVLARIELKRGSRNLRIWMQDNLVKNCWSIHRARLERDLPFYQGQGGEILSSPPYGIAHYYIRDSID